MGSIAGYFRMMRVDDWLFGYFFIPLIGTVAAAGITPVLWITAVVSAGALAFGFVINNVADIEIDLCHADKCKANKNPLATQKVTTRGTTLLLILLALIPLCLSLLCTLTAFLCVTATLGLFAAYSVRPFRLKERYLLDLFTHGIMAGALLFLIGYTLPGTGDPLISPKVISLAVLFTGIGCMALLVHQIGDYAEDREYSPTTVVRLGKKKAWVMLVALFSLTLTCLAIVHSIVVLELWVLFGSVVLFAIPLFLLRNEIREDFFPSVHPAKEPE